MSNDHNTTSNWRPQTRLVRGGTQRSPFDETSEGMFLTSGYVYGSAEDAEAAFKGDVDRYIYSRYGNPTVDMFQERLAALEGAKHCVATSSGMAAVFAALASQIGAGNRIVAARALFGSCSYIVEDMLPRFGAESVFVDGTDLEQWEQALSQPTDCVFLETPSNPTLEIIDLRTLWPWDQEMVFASVAKTKRLMVVHEAVQVGGFGAEIAATVAEHMAHVLVAPIRRLGAPRAPISYAKPLEDLLRITPEKIVALASEQMAV